MRVLGATQCCFVGLGCCVRLRLLDVLHATSNFLGAAGYDTLGFCKQLLPLLFVEALPSFCKEILQNFLNARAVGFVLVRPLRLQKRNGLREVHLLALRRRSAVNEDMFGGNKKCSE